VSFIEGAAESWSAGGSGDVSILSRAGVDRTD